jgi:hypothetical protein
VTVDSSALEEPVYTAESTDLHVQWLGSYSSSVIETRQVRSSVPPRRLGLAAKAAVAASLTGVALAGITAPGLRADDRFGRSPSSSVRDLSMQVDEKPVPLSWADVVASSTAEFLAIEAKRVALAEREAELYDSYEFDDEDWMA